MSLPIRTLPIVERWDCHNCAVCCRGTIVVLDDNDVARLREQAWENHPDFRGTRIIRPRGILNKMYTLAKRRDGSCVFLLPDGLCRIHSEFGYEAKPLVCRTAPLQAVPLEKFAYLTLRRYCPSAAAGRGRELQEHLDVYRKLIDGRQSPLGPTEPPAPTPGHRRPWKDVLRVTDVIERLVLDDRYPVVRRLVHSLQFCNLLGQCRLRNLDSRQLGELLAILEVSCTVGIDELFRNRLRPGRTAAALFRQTALEYVRLHPSFVIEESLMERWRLIRAAMAFALAKGRVPRIHPSFPPTTFKALERPLGPLGEDVLRPINAFFEAAAASKHYAVLGKPGWSVVESFRALALAYPIAMWMLRLTCGDRPPEAEDAVGVVGAIDRGQTYALLAGRRHRRRVAGLNRRGELARIIAWYAR